MAVQASLGRRDACEIRVLDRGVAVAAINSQAGNVVLMAECDRLGLHHTLVGDVRRTLDFSHRPEQCSYNEYGAKDCGPGDCVRTAMKDLHRRPVQWADFLNQSRFMQRCWGPSVTDCGDDVRGNQGL